MPGKHYINSESLNAIQVCPNPNVQALFSSVFVQRKIMLCSENTTEIGFQVVPHSSHHGMSHQLGFQHWKVCYKAHLSSIYRNWKNLTLYQHLGSSESVKLFPQLSFLDGHTGVFYFLLTHKSNPLLSTLCQHPNSAKHLLWFSPSEQVPKSKREGPSVLSNNYESQMWTLPT